MKAPIKDLNLKDKVAVVTGGSGVICSAMAKALAMHGVKTAILNRTEESAKKIAQEIMEMSGVTSIGISADVLDKSSLEAAKKIINEQLGSIDFLINGAGGNSPLATTKVEEMTENDSLEDTFFGLEMEGVDHTFKLNFNGTLLPTMIFSRDMIEKKSGGIVNLSSMSAYEPMTKVAAYSAAKAAINNFTYWLAVHFAKTGVRVNAIAPGFLLTNQNRFLLVDEKTGESTPRGEKIINNTPMGRYGEPEEMTGTLLYLLSDWSEFVTGTVIPVDGGFNAFSGV